MHACVTMLDHKNMTWNEKDEFTLRNTKEWPTLNFYKTNHLKEDADKLNKCLYSFLVFLVRDPKIEVIVFKSEILIYLFIPKFDNYL